MGRRPKHPLNRYAIPIDDQIDFCLPLANRLFVSMNDRSREGFVSTAREAVRFSERVARENAEHFARSAEAMELENLRWVNAFERALERAGVRHAPTTAEKTNIAAYYLHILPTYFDVPSILQDVINRFGGTVSWSHLMQMVPVLKTDHPVLPALLGTFEVPSTDLYIATTLEDPDKSRYISMPDLILDDLEANRRTAIQILDEVSERRMTPNQLRLMITELPGIDPG